MIRLGDWLIGNCRAVVTASLLASQLSAPASPQSPSPSERSSPLLPAYWAAVRDYQVTGSLERAQRIVGSWSRQQFESVIDQAVRVPDGARLAAAAVFHLEIADSVAQASPDGALQHIRFGERFVRDVAGLQPEVGDAAFVGRWYAAAASIFVAQTDLRRARPIVERGLERARESAHVHVLAGTIEDMEAQQVDLDVAQDAGGSQRAMRREAVSRFDVRSRLALAERAYRQALRLDGSMMAARLRLGRVLFLLDRQADARAQLEAAVQDAVAPGDRYLARLFLAEVYLQAGDIDAAHRLLTEVVTTMPDRQTAWLALAALEERAGRHARARAVVHEGLARRSEPPADEWWDYRNGALDEAALIWLRAHVRR